MSSHRTPAGRPGHNRGRRYPAEILNAEEIQRLLHATNRGSTGMRNRALIAVLYRSGLRLSEALALKRADADHDAGTIRVLHGKGDRARTVGLDETAGAMVALWVAERKRLGLNGGKMLFCQLDGSAWSPQGVREMLRRATVKAGIEKRVHPHGLRHTHAAELAREGAPMNLIQAQLGHASLAVTDRYLRHIAPAELVERIRARDWST